MADQLITGTTLIEDKRLASKAEGTYEPTVTSISNLDAAPTVTGAFFVRVGNIVSVAGGISQNPTSSSTNTSFRITLPVSSSFTDTSQCAGTFHSVQNGDEHGSINAHVANNEAVFEYNAISAGTSTVYFNFMYQVI